MDINSFQETATDGAKKVMLIDDSDIALIFTQYQLNTWGVKSILLPSGFSALVYIEGHLGQEHLLPDLIVLDVDMPVVNAWEFLEKFESLKNRISKPVRVSILSGHSPGEQYDYWKAKGCVQNFFIKPLKTTDIPLMLGTTLKS